MELSFLATFDKYMMCHIEFSSDKNKLVFYFWISWSYAPSYGIIFIRCAAIFFRKWFPDSRYQRFWAKFVEFCHSTQSNWINNIITSHLCKKNDEIGSFLWKIWILNSCLKNLLIVRQIRNVTFKIKTKTKIDEKFVKVWRNVISPVWGLL